MHNTQMQQIADLKINCEQHGMSVHAIPSELKLSDGEKPYDFMILGGPPGIDLILVYGLWSDLKNYGL